MLVSLHCINVRDIPAVDIDVTQPTTSVTSQEEASIVARNKLSFDNRARSKVLLGWPSSGVRPPRLE